jgi:hypothetical protein
METKKIIHGFWIGMFCLYGQSMYGVSPEALYNQEIERLSQQLEKTSFLPSEKRNLIYKLTNYFSNETTRALPVVDNKKTDVLYGSIIHSYHKLFKDSKNPRTTTEPLAKQFQEQVIGKLWLHKNNLYIYEVR